MYACICHGVTESEVRSHIAAGACSPRDIGNRCGAGTGCGMCRGKLARMLRAENGEAARSVQPVLPVAAAVATA